MVRAWSRAPVPAGTAIGSWLIEDGLAMRDVRRLVSSHASAGDDSSLSGSAARRLELVFSELVSNALRHGEHPVEVVLYDREGDWLLDVVDSCAEPPAPRANRGTYEAGGRGLTIVEELTARHGWTLDDGKKHVWAEVVAGPSTVD
jgi:two-component sensor histidine kinase